jgi:hypothetical protein
VIARTDEGTLLVDILGLLWRWRCALSRLLRVHIVLGGLMFLFLPFG